MDKKKLAKYAIFLVLYAFATAILIKEIDYAREHVTISWH